MKETQELDLFVEELKQSNKAVIVEGRKDKEALEKLGIKRVYALNCKPLFVFIEQIAKNNKDVIILTDLDKEGKKLYRALSSGLQKYGVRVDNYFREFIFKKTRIRQIEGFKLINQLS